MNIWKGIIGNKLFKCGAVYGDEQCGGMDDRPSTCQETLLNHEKKKIIYCKCLYPLENSILVYFLVVYEFQHEFLSSRRG